MVQISGGTVRQLPGSRTAGQLLRTTFGGAQTALSAGDGHLRQQLRGLHVLIQPQAEGVLHPRRETNAAHWRDDRRSLVCPATADPIFTG